MEQIIGVLRETQAGALRSDHGPEFIACAIQDWLKEKQVKVI